MFLGAFDDSRFLSTCWVRVTSLTYPILACYKYRSTPLNLRSMLYDFFISEKLSMTRSTHVSCWLAILLFRRHIFNEWWYTSSFGWYRSLHNRVSWYNILGWTRSHRNMLLQIIWVINSFICEGATLVSIENALLEFWLGRHLQNVLEQLLLFFGCPTI